MSAVAMHCLFFDVRPKPGHMPNYFTHVEKLKPILARHRGLLYLERFRPLDAPNELLSHQLWADEASIAAWRADPTHRASQVAGRKVHFDDYRIRVGRQEFMLPDRPTGQGLKGRYLVAAYGTAPTEHGRAHESVTRPGRYLTLAEAASGDLAQSVAGRALEPGIEEVRVFRVARDYSMTDRAEAPG